MVRLIGVVALVAMARLGVVVIGAPEAHADGLLGEVVSNRPVTGTTSPAGPPAPATGLVDAATGVAESVVPPPAPVTTAPPAIAASASAASAPPSPPAAPASSSAPSAITALTSAPAELTGALPAPPPSAPDASPASSTESTPDSSTALQPANQPAVGLPGGVMEAAVASPGAPEGPRAESLSQPAVSLPGDAPSIVDDALQEPLAQPVLTLLDAPALGAIAGEQGLVPALVEPVVDAVPLSPVTSLDVTEVLNASSLVLEPVVEGVGPIIELATDALVPALEIATPLVDTTTALLAGTVAQVLTPVGNTAEALVAPLMGVETTTTVTAFLAPTGGLDSALGIVLTPGSGDAPPQASGTVAPASAAGSAMGETDNAAVINHVRDEGASAARGPSFRPVGDLAVWASSEGRGSEASAPADPGPERHVPAASSGRLALPVTHTSDGEWPAVPDASPLPNSIVAWLGNTVAGSGAMAPVSGAGFAAVLTAIFAVHTAFSLARKVSMDGRAFYSLTLTPIQPPG